MIISIQGESMIIPLVVTDICSTHTHTSVDVHKYTHTHTYSVRTDKKLCY